MLIDTHAHVNFNAFKDDGEDVLRRCIENGMQVINVGSQYSTSRRAVEYANKFEDGVWAAVGLHPVHIKKGSFMHRDENEVPASTRGDSSTRGGEETEIKTNGEEFAFEKYLDLAKNEKVVAIGEVGLDYHHFEKGDDVELLKKKQKENLIESIDMANHIEKPVILHCWGVKSKKDFDHARTDAYDDLLEILDGNLVIKGGVVHSFVGGYKTAQKFIDLGYKIGLNGIITYSESYDRLIREIGLENIVLETDCPYLTPKPLEKGTRNEPLFVEKIAQKISDVLDTDISEVSEKTTKNAKDLFNL